MGDADAVKSTALGIKNLQRVTRMLMSATAYKEGDTYEQLAELYGRVVNQWATEMNHVAGIVGGYNSQEKVVGQEGRIFSLIPKDRQQAAVKFLLENAFLPPIWMIDEEILRRIEPVGAIERIHNAQNRVLANLLNSGRFARLVEQETLDGTLAYSPVEFLVTIRKGLWKELDGPQVKINTYRRELQRSYLQAINTKLNPPAAAAAATVFPAPDGGGRGFTRPSSFRAAPAGPPRCSADPASPVVPAPDGGRGFSRPPSSGDEKPLYRTELRALSGSVTAAIAKAADHETKAHLEAVKDEIAKILDPKFVMPAPSAGTTGGGRGGEQVR